jgi:hypothetical protein
MPIDLGPATQYFSMFNSPLIFSLNSLASTGVAHNTNKMRVCLGLFDLNARVASIACQRGAKRVQSLRRKLKRRLNCPWSHERLCRNQSVRE